MNRQAPEESAGAGIDGRCAFGFAILLSGIGLLLLMDRIGMPDSLVRALAFLFVACGIAAIALLLRTMRVSAFYAGARAIPAPYAGLAMAGLGAALFLPFVSTAREDASFGASLGSVFAGFACGLALAALVTGPLLRKTGAFSLPDLIAARFPLLIVRVGSSLLTAAICGLAALAGYQEAVAALTDLTGLSLPLACAIIATLLSFVILPGGVSGVLWAATSSAIVAVTVFALPLLIDALKDHPPALPFIAPPERLSATMAHLEGSGGAHGVDVLLIAAIALGLGVLPPLLAPAIAGRNRRGAQRGGIAALFWGAIFALIGLADLALADWDAPAKGSPLVQSLSGFGPPLSGLASASVFALGLALAAIAIQCCATVLGNDLFYRVRDRSALTSRRLAVTRAIAILILSLCSACLSLFTLEPQSLIALSILLSASVLAPLLILCLWPAATSIDAGVALLVGVLTMEIVTGRELYGPMPDRFAQAAWLACGFGLAAAFLTTLIRRKTSKALQPEEGKSFLQAIIGGQDEWLHPDKGA